MKAAGFPANEKERLEELASYRVFEGSGLPVLGQLSELAARLLDVPIVAISVFDESQQRFLGSHGIEAVDGPRETAICGHVVEQEKFLAIEDTLEDPRFADNPYVVGEPYVRFYLGCPLVSGNGYALGTICAFDSVTGSVNADKAEILEIIARQVVTNLELHRQLHRAEEMRLVEERLTAEAKAAQDQLQVSVQDLQAVNEELNQFAFVVSHDLLAPIRHMSTYAEILEEELGANVSGEARQALEFVTGAARQARGMIRDMLNHSQITRDRIVLGQCDLGEIVQDALDLIQDTVESKKPTVEVSDHLQLYCDRALMVVAFSHILENAMNYSHPDVTPKIQISAFLKRDEVSSKRDEVRIVIEDNGTGIEPSKRAQAFRLFNTQPEPMANRSGLGLAFCNKIIQCHRGKIAIESAKIRGTRFIISLPAFSASEGEKHHETIETTTGDDRGPQQRGGKGGRDVS